jgi:peptidoglycan/LPS O-acetylase OafA/YrhL
MTSIGAVLDRNRGLGPGFDFLRVALAISVVAWHTAPIALGRNPLDFFVVWFPGYAVIVAFFALSGFLITGSAMRLRLRDFLINRSLRIVPALAVEVVLAALILGTIFTTLPRAEYLTHPEMWRYFTNIIGLINFQLPGVFKNAPSDTVNVTLWTVPYEVLCYVIMSGIMIFGLLKRPRLILLGAALAIGAGMLWYVTGHGEPANPLAFGIKSATFGKGSSLFVGFLLGIAVYLYRYKIPYSGRLALGATVICAIVAVLGPTEFDVPLLNLIVAPPLAYIVAYLGISPIPTLPVFHRGDYSYGIYLYGFPVMQAVRAVAPEPIAANPWLLFAVSLPVMTLFAIFSWHAIEKPILRLRKKFSFVARQRLIDTPAVVVAPTEIPASVPAAP